MFSFHTVFVLSIFALVAIVGSTNGYSGCDDELSRQRTEMYDKQTQSYSESIDRMGRITISCETSTGGGRGGSSGGNNGSITIVEISLGFFFLLWVIVGIYFVFAARQKAMNAAAITPYSGEVVGGCGMDEKTNTVPAGKVSYGNNNV